MALSTTSPDPIVAPIRRLAVRHLTRYQYAQPVTRGRHLLRLRPIHDHLQSLEKYRLQINQDGSRRDFEEAFGNLSTRLELTAPHTELEIVAESVVSIRQTDPFALLTPDYRQTFPITWMPWERRMLEPYLEPPELPEAQLTTLYEFAHQLAAENNQDVTETLFALNLKLFREFVYAPGSTTLETTAYDVFTQKQGVCQDFANLFICLARLLELPARYVCGYVLTSIGGNMSAAHQATHGWCEVYLPNIGWMGFDPTNGTIPTLDHVRVSRGRNYKDATPTTGWLEPAVAHTLGVEVSVEIVGSPDATSTVDPAATDAPIPHVETPGAKQPATSSDSTPAPVKAGQP